MYKNASSRRIKLYNRFVCACFHSTIHDAYAAGYAWIVLRKRLGYEHETTMEGTK